MALTISVIVCAHNESRLLFICLYSLVAHPAFGQKAFGLGPGDFDADIPDASTSP